MITRRTTSGKRIRTIVAAAFCMAAMGCGGPAGQSEAANEGPVETFGTEEQSPDVTMAHYEQIEKGMSYDEVVEIIGSRGELIGEEDYAGNPMDIYHWVNYDGGSLVCNFEDDRLVKKTQGGLQ